MVTWLVISTSAYADAQTTAPLLVKGNPIDPTCLLSSAHPEGLTPLAIDLRHCISVLGRDQLGHSPIFRRRRTHLADNTYSVELCASFWKVGPSQIVDIAGSFIVGVETWDARSSLTRGVDREASYRSIRCEFRFKYRSQSRDAISRNALIGPEIAKTISDQVATINFNGARHMWPLPDHDTGTRFNCGMTKRNKVATILAVEHFVTLNYVDAIRALPTTMERHNHKSRRLL
jgi:hypothetical protein